VSLIARQFILHMSWIHDVDNPECPSHFALDCWTASLSPEDGVEGANASVPNIGNEAATASTVEPISTLRVSLLALI
jgi:hypothetical protein